MLWLFTGIGLTSAAVLIATWIAPRAAPADEPPRTIASIVLPRGLDLQAAVCGAGIGRAIRRVSGWSKARADCRRRVAPVSALGSRPRLRRASATTGNRRRLVTVLVSGFRVDWVRRGGRLRTLRLAGGSPTTVHRRGSATAPGAATISSSSRRQVASPLLTVPALGGTPKAATTLEQAGGEVQQEDPAFLPDGRRFLYSSMGGPSGALDQRGIYLASLDAPGQAKAADPGRHAAAIREWSRLLRAERHAAGAAARRDERRPPRRPCASGRRCHALHVGATGSTAAYSVSDNVLAYQAAVRTESSLMWFDRAGRALASLTDQADYSDVALSPDGTRLAVSLRDPSRFTRDLWLHDTNDGRGPAPHVRPE